MSSSARIDELRKKFDENPRRYFAPLANEYRKAGDFDQAIFICQEYLPQQPGHMSGHIVFGQALFEAKRLPEARTVFETALTLDPENLIALRHLADISRDLGETTVARGWYERVLQADPRNEEIAAIVAAMPVTGTQKAAAAPTAESPTKPPAAPAPAAIPTPAKPAPASAAAPTMELSAAAVQEMLRARQATQQQETPAPEKLTLDEAPTVEVNALPSSTLEGFETTSHEGLLDIPSGGMLGLEPTSAASPSQDVAAPAAPEGLDTIALEDFSLPASGATPVTAVPPASPKAESAPAGGLLDFDSFDLGGEAAATPPAAAAPSLVVPAMDFAMPPVEAPAAPVATAPPDGPVPLADFDFEVPASLPPMPPQESAPTMVMDAIGDTIPVELDMIDVDAPAIVDPVASAPTMIMDAIRIDAPTAAEPPGAAKEPPKASEGLEAAPTQLIDVASVKEQIAAARKTEPAATPGARPAAAFVTETMAQLYLEQGHRAEAIEIYRQLVAARPDDAGLRGRFEAVERGGGSSAPQPTGPATSPALPRASEPAPVPTVGRFAASGPTIRTVLRELFGIDGHSTSGGGGANGGGARGDGEIGSIDVLFSAESVPDELGPLASAFDGGYVATSGTIDAVFATDGR